MLMGAQNPASSMAQVRCELAGRAAPLGASFHDEAPLQLPTIPCWLLDCIPAVRRRPFDQVIQPAWCALRLHMVLQLQRAHV